MKAKLIEFVNKMVWLFYGFIGVFTLVLLGFLINYSVEMRLVENNRKGSLKHIDCLKDFTHSQCNNLERNF